VCVYASISVFFRSVASQVDYTVLSLAIKISSTLFICRYRRHVFGNTSILWYVAPLVCNDRDISNYTTAVTRQRPVNSNRGTGFSVRSV
jgi:hypothetical protein